jgi:hypothetical protein
MANLVKAKDLQLADVVKPVSNSPMPFATCTVKQIKDGLIHLFRPYVHTADFCASFGVICYIGFEDYTIYANDQEYELLERRALK